MEAVVDVLDFFHGHAVEYHFVRLPVLLLLLALYRFADLCLLLYFSISALSDQVSSATFLSSPYPEARVKV